MDDKKKQSKMNRILLTILTATILIVAAIAVHITTTLQTDLTSKQTMLDLSRQTACDLFDEVVEWKNKYDGLQARMVEKGADNKPDDVVIAWAYTNAASFVPRSEIIPIVVETKRYRTYLMLLSVFKEESGFNQYARSNKEAKGLGQIITKTSGNAKWAGWLPTLIEEGIFTEEIDVFDTHKNIAATDYILNVYYQETGSWKNALLKYVNGDSSYVTRVLSNFAELTLLLAEESDARNTEVSKTSGGHRGGESTAANATTLENTQIR